MASRLVAPPSMDWQASLFGDADPAPDWDFATVERIDLGDGAWVDVAPGWMAGADTLFERLLADVPWQEREVPMYEKVVPEPRLSCWWGDGASRPWPPAARAMARALHGRYGVRFDALGANLYRDGRDSVAWHGDRVYREQDTALVAVLSLGCQRRFLLRPKGGGPSVRLDPAPGDLLVMGGTCQRTWQHGVPKVAQVSGPRISVSLRHRAELDADGDSWYDQTGRRATSEAEAGAPASADGPSAEAADEPDGPGGQDVAARRVRVSPSATATQTLQAKKSSASNARVVERTLDLARPQ